MDSHCLGGGGDAAASFTERVLRPSSRRLRLAYRAAPVGRRGPPQRERRRLLGHDGRRGVRFGGVATGAPGRCHHHSAAGARSSVDVPPLPPATPPLDIAVVVTTPPSPGAQPRLRGLLRAVPRLARVVRLPARVLHRRATSRGPTPRAGARRRADRERGVRAPASGVLRALQDRRRRGGRQSRQGPPRRVTPPARGAEGGPLRWRNLRAGDISGAARPCSAMQCSVHADRRGCRAGRRADDDCGLRVAACRRRGLRLDRRVPASTFQDVLRSFHASRRAASPRQGGQAR